MKGKTHNFRRAVFTICSNNYLAQASLAIKSFQENHSDYYCLIVIVDRPNKKVNYNEFIFCDIMFIEELKINDFPELAAKYNIIELNTAVKPTIIMHLFGCKYSQVTYIDPDTYFFNRQSLVEELLCNHSIPFIITPHTLKPIDDDLPYTDQHILKFGIFNLGYIVLQQCDVTWRFLEWWENRLKKYCFANIADGMFTDQLWINHIPVFFPEGHILRHLGYNMSYWNLHERSIEQVDHNYIIKESLEPLIFYHFSHYKPETDDRIVSSFKIRYDFITRPDIVPIYRQYNESLVENNYSNFKSINFAFKCKTKNKKLLNNFKIIFYKLKYKFLDF